MGISPFLFSLFLVAAISRPPPVCGNAELTTLMEVKASLDPGNTFLTSWDFSVDPCDGGFEGVACNEKGQVANISLQGKGLTGKLSPAISGLRHLTGLYLHYNSLYGEIPREISYLSELSDLYLNVNNLSGNIPSELGNMANLQVLQLCYNQLTGHIPTELGSLRKLSVVALQSNLLSGAIPASLGDLEMLARLDLSFNHLFGSIPTKLADAPVLEILDVRNNTLSGNVPQALERLSEGFQYKNNPELCGVGFLALRECNALDHINPNRPEPYEGGPTGGDPTREIPETANLKLNCSDTHCSNSSKTPQASIVVGVIVVTVALSAIGIMAFLQYRRQKEKLGNLKTDVCENRASTDQPMEVYKKNGSPLINLEYSNGWDPLADGRSFGGFSQEVIRSFKFNLEEVESATQYFAGKNLLGRSGFSATYRGVLRDGSVVAVKRISKASCKSEEGEFLRGLKILTSLRHDNLVRLRGICCSKSRGECFLIYEFIANGNLLSFMDLKEGDARVLEWSTRVSIVNGIAKGIQYLHGYNMSKPSLVHQSISAAKVLIDQRFNPLLSDSGVHNLLTNDTVFSALKACAAMGYLAPEYTTTGRFTEKSDVYAFGVLILQTLSGKSKISSLIRVAAESCKFADFVDKNLHGKFSESEAGKLTEVALMCTNESPEERPSMEAIVEELGNLN